MDSTAHLNIVVNPGTLQHENFLILNVLVSFEMTINKCIQYTVCDHTIIVFMTNHVTLEQSGTHANPQFIEGQHVSSILAP